MSELAGERLEKGSVFRKIMVAAGNEHARFMFNISRAAFLVPSLITRRKNETARPSELEEKLL